MHKPEIWLPVDTHNALAAWITLLVIGGRLLIGGRAESRNHVLMWWEAVITGCVFSGRPDLPSN